MAMAHDLARRLSMRQLRLVAVLGRELSLSRTAAALHTTQPAVSRSLSQLEELLDTRLFERTTKRVNATAAGLSLLHYAMRILAELDQAGAELSGIRGGLRGEVRVGALWAFSPTLIARAIRRCGDSLPDVRFHITTADVQSLSDALANRHIDLMLSHAEFPVDLRKVEVVEFYEEHSAVIVAPGHRLTRRRHPCWADLANEPWVLPPRSTPLRPKLERMLALHRDASRPLRADAFADDPAHALALVQEADMLWAIASRRAADFEAAGLVKRITPPADLLRGPMCGFWSRAEPPSTPVRLFIRSLAEAADE